MNIKKLLALASSLLLVPLIQAEVETSVSLEIPIASVGIEIGHLTEGNHYFSASYHYGVGDVNRLELGWSKVISENEPHLLGLGYGRISTLDKLGSFSANRSFDVGSINYRYYTNGIRNTGLHSYVALSFDDTGAIPFLGIGYNY